MDLWNYQTDNGRSIRKAIDWLYPYGIGQKKWEYDQITPAKTADLFGILRCAAIAYHEPKYEELATKAEAPTPSPAALTCCTPSRSSDRWHERTRRRKRPPRAPRPPAAAASHYRVGSHAASHR